MLMSFAKMFGRVNIISVSILVLLLIEIAIVGIESVYTMCLLKQNTYNIRKYWKEKNKIKLLDTIIFAVSIISMIMYFISFSGFVLYIIPICLIATIAISIFIVILIVQSRVICKVVLFDKKVKKILMVNILLYIVLALLEEISCYMFIFLPEMNRGLMGSEGVMNGLGLLLFFTYMFVCFVFPVPIAIAPMFTILSLKIGNKINLDK